MCGTFAMRSPSYRVARKVSLPRDSDQFQVFFLDVLGKTDVGIADVAFICKWVLPVSTEELPGQKNTIGYPPEAGSPKLPPSSKLVRQWMVRVNEAFLVINGDKKTYVGEIWLSVIVFVICPTWSSLMMIPNSRFYLAQPPISNSPMATKAWRSMAERWQVSRRPAWSCIPTASSGRSWPKRRRGQMDFDHFTIFTLW